MSNELGAGKPHAARSVVVVSMVIGVLNGAIMASLIYSLRDVWGWAFTNDAEVVQQVAHTVPYLAVLASSSTDSVALLTKKETEFDPEAAAFWKPGEHVPFLFLARAFDSKLKSPE